MPGTYARINKISNAGGRHEYLTDPKRQEEVVLHEVHMQYDWAFYAQYEQDHQQQGQKYNNHEALEVHLSLPNELADDKPKLKRVCDDLAREIVGPNHDYEYAVHWNHDRTNLHVHIMFSERALVQEREPKIYAKDIWQDKDTHKLAKANAENAELVHRKGEVQKDKDGNIKYKDEPLTVKDLRFKNIHFPQEKNEIVARVLKEYGYELRVQTKDSPYLSQKKLYKGASADYIEKAKEYNAAVKEYNEAVEQHIKLEPEIAPTYCEIRHDIEEKIREENRKNKITVHRNGEDKEIGTISNCAIQAIKEMAAFVKEQVRNLAAKLRSKFAESSIGEWWQANGKRLAAKIGSIEEKKAVVKTAEAKIDTATVQIGKDQSLIDAEREAARIKEERKEKARQKLKERAEQKAAKKIEHDHGMGGIG
jgi:hypothetical protein